MTHNSEILIFSEKHGDAYFDASTPAKRAAAFLHVLRERFNDGWYYEPSEPTVDAEQLAFSSMTDEQIGALPESVAADMRQRRDRARRSISAASTAYAREQKWYDAVAELVALPTAEAIARKGANGRVSLAEQLAYAHADYEYEGYESEYLSVAAEV